MRTHEESIGAGLERVSMRRRETHEAAKRRPAIVEPVFQTDEDVGRVFDAWGKERLVDVRDSIRITMSGNSLKPNRFGSEGIVKRSELEWIATLLHVSITLIYRLILDSRATSLAFDDYVGGIFVDGEIDAGDFRTRARDLRNPISVVTIDRGVTARPNAGMTTRKPRRCSVEARSARRFSSRFIP